MYAVPSALREAAYGIGARRRTVTRQGRLPGGGLGHRGVPDPGLLPRARRDDGGGDRRRRDRRCPRHWNPLEPGQTMTGAISSLAIGSDQVKSRAHRVNPFDALYFVGLLLFVMTLAMNVCPSASSAGSGGTTDGGRSPRPPRSAARSSSRLRGTKRDVAGRVFQGALLLSLLLSLLILIVLLGTTLVRRLAGAVDQAG